jgi:hypothetical protein
MLIPDITIALPKIANLVRLKLGSSHLRESLVYILVAGLKFWNPLSDRPIFFPCAIEK